MAVAELVAADEGHHVAALGLHGGQSALHQRFLLEEQGDGLLRRDHGGIEVHGLGGGFALFAAFGLDGHGRGRDHDQVVDVQHLAGVAHGGSAPAGDLAVGGTGPGHVGHGDVTGVALAQHDAGALGVHGGDHGLHPGLAHEVGRSEGAFFAELGHLGRGELLDRAAPALALVQLFQTAAQGRARGILLHGIHGGTHGEARGVDVFLAALQGIDAQGAQVLFGEEFHQQTAGFFEIPFGGPAAVLGHAPVDQGLVDGLLVLFLCDPLEGAQTAEDVHLAGLGGLGMPEGIVAAGGLGQAGDDGALGQGDVGSVLAEVGPGRGFHTVGVLPQIDVVEVGLEDVVLADGVFQPVGQDGFLHLAGVAAFRTQQELFDDLLGDGAAALLAAAGGFVAQVVDEGAHDGHGIDTMMLVEGIVFRSQEGHGQPGRHLLEGDAVAFFRGEGADGGAVTGQDDRGLRGFVTGKAFQVGQVARGPVEQAGHGGAAEDAQREQQAKGPEEDFFYVHGKADTVFLSARKGRARGAAGRERKRRPPARGDA